MVGVNSHPQWVPAQSVLPQHLQWVNQQPSFHDPLLCGICLWRGLHRIPGASPAPPGSTCSSISSQITALLVFSVMAISYRVHHGEGSRAFQLVNGIPVDYNVVQEPVIEDGQAQDGRHRSAVTAPKMDDDGMPVPEMKDGKPVPFTITYAASEP